MSETTKKNDGFASRIGYIFSMLGMSVGVGAMWRFPMYCAQYGGGTFVLAFVLITILIVIPAGWAESALGRKYRKSVVGTYGQMFGKKGAAFGYIYALTMVFLLSYYPIVMGQAVMYIGYTFAGAPFLKDTESFYSTVNNNRIGTYILVIAIILLTGFISSKGIEKGVEKVCKILLPLMFVFLIIIDIRVFTLPGIGDGIAAYVDPHLNQLGNSDMWASAAGMALFAVGLGPGYLLTYGIYVDEKQDIATDFLTVNITQLFVCILSGFAIIPAVVLFGLNPTSGKGLVFMALPMVFSKIGGGLIWFVLFMLAFFFAGLSTTLSMMEITVTCLMDGLNLTRTNAITVMSGLSALIAIPCVWNDAFFAFFDNLTGNVLYCVTALGTALILAWYVGAKTVRTEWYNPTSVIKWGAWVDILYKFIACPAFIYFTITSIMTLF